MSTAIAATTTTTEKGELKFTIKPFDGKRENYSAFEASAAIYLKLNADKYNNDEKQILWVLGHLSEGTASTWRNDYLRLHQTAGVFDISNQKIADFMRDLKAAFDSTTEETDAENELRILKQGTMPAEEFFTEFELLCGRAKIIDDKHKIELLKQTMNQRLLTKIVYSESHMAKDCPKKRSNPPRSDKPWWKEQEPRSGNNNYARSSNRSTENSEHAARKFTKDSARKFIREIEWENEDEKEAFLNEYDPEDF
ncbi:hypothetical protein HYPSUDRAFT_201602 [Hypholoma sublateritium FD-334 SS-4]|uniref:Ty3 transposon capsid-like protein domain-containing protein n=1 Tax=Hypholoma sublateritium (strain FD-334 SS-4) TaxID=945553 RepID=A0A0D2PTM9_HYPSF|nr:hypothetical protein HYPSUDRAFT_201602 [Hypholoma sublateritium FD-334 SS-4]